MQHIMLRRIFKGLFLVILLCFSSSFIQAADTQLDYESTKSKVLNVQAVNPNLPIISGQEQKGSIGYIISKMFDSNGKIGNWFLNVLGTRSDGAILRWSGGNAGQLVQGSIFDDGTNVGIGTTSPVATSEGGSATTFFHIKNISSTGDVEIARFEGGTDANNTAAIVRINHANDRGLYLKGGRRNSDNSFAELGIINTNGSLLAPSISFNDSGNVGIGNIGSSYKLDVTGDINFTGDIRKNGTILNLAGKFQDAATAGKIYYNAGNVGIGTNNPQTQLHVAGSATIVAEGSNYPSVYIKNSGKTDGVFGRTWGWMNYGNGLHLNGYGSVGINIAPGGPINAMFIQDGTGRVGIGTTAPISLLEVKAANNVTGVLTVGGGKSVVTAVGEINAQLDFRSNDASMTSPNQIGGRIASVTEYSNGAYAGLAFYTGRQGRTPVLQEAMRIKNNGNVGIGTPAPFAKLTSAPSSANPANGIDTFGLTTTGTYGGGIGLRDGTGDFGLWLDTTGTAARFGFGTSLGALNTKMSILSNGNVGIGTTSPYHKLQVKGDVSIGDDDGYTPNNLYLYGTTAGAYSRLFTSNGNLHVDAGYGGGSGNEILLNYYNGGNVTIGNPSKLSDLHVNGNIITSGSIKTTCIGNCF